jgi:putative ABC transport system permease protein
VVNVTLQAWGYYPTGAHRVAFVEEASQRIRALPGIEAAGMTSSLPLSVPIGMERTGITIEGQPAVTEQERPVVHVAAISSDYPEVLQIPLKAGRMFDERDHSTSGPVAMVNEAFVRRYWAGQAPLGKRVTLRFQGPPAERTVVGVMGDVRHSGLHSDAAPAVFVPHAQAPTGAVQLVARTSGDVVLAQRSIRAELSKMNGAMPLSEITSLEARMSDSLRERRFHLGLLGAFSLTALLLAAVGIYGVMNQLTSERTREIGVRVALGARANDVVWMVLRQGMSIASAGLVAGLLIALASTRLMSGMLFQVEPLDAFTYVGALTVIVLVAGCASLIPAMRAAATNPVTVLRSD